MEDIVVGRAVWVAEESFEGMEIVVIELVCDEVVVEFWELYGSSEMVGFKGRHFGEVGRREAAGAGEPVEEEGAPWGWGRGVLGRSPWLWMGRFGPCHDGGGEDGKRGPGSTGTQ